MRSAIAVLFATAVLFHPSLVASALAQDAAAPKDSAAQASQSAGLVADAWLEQVDAGNYEESWRQAAAAFRAAVTGQQWSEAMRAVRAPLGAVRSRKRIAAQYTRQIPGAPQGEYVVVQYLTEFAGRSATETVTPMREADGSWKVSGYYIQ